MDLKVKIGCVLFTPHGWDVCGAVIRHQHAVIGGYAVTSFDRLILNLISAGY